MVTAVKTWPEEVEEQVQIVIFNLVILDVKLEACLDAFIERTYSLVPFYLWGDYKSGSVHARSLLREIMVALSVILAHKYSGRAPNWRLLAEEFYKNSERLMAYTHEIESNLERDYIPVAKVCLQKSREMILYMTVKIHSIPRDYNRIPSVYLENVDI